MAVAPPLRQPWKTRVVAALALASVVFACVPASEKHPPAGAGGFVIEPSPGARGEPFTTREGWTITIDKLMVRARVSVNPTVSNNGTYTQERNEAHLFDGSKQAQIFTPGVDVGDARISASLDSRSIYFGPDSNYKEDLDIVNVGPEDVARFEQAADQGLQGASGYVYGSGPSVLLELHATKAERTMSLRTAISTGYGSFDDRGGVVIITILEDDVSYAQLDVRPEAVFDASLPFEMLLGADANGDGVVTGEELRLAAPPTTSANRVGSETLLDTLATQLGSRLLVPASR